jgi:hypothetical protein
MGSAHVLLRPYGGTGSRPVWCALLAGRTSEAPAAVIRAHAPMGVR